MGSVSHLTSHTASRNDINANFSRPSLLNTRNVIAKMHDFSHEQRLCAGASQSCYDQMLKIPKMVGDFFVHRYADMRMFMRAFGSMFGSTTPSEIDRRVSEIRQFQIVMQDCLVTGQTANRRFARLTTQTRDLLFYTDAGYIAQFQNETDPVKMEAIRLEILRECDQAISFQRTLTVVNTFFRAFTGATASAGSTPSEEGPMSSFWSMLARCLGQGPGGRRPERATPSPVTGPGATSPGVDLNIPDTVPYVRGSIPASIQEKAEEIERWSAVFIGVIPGEFKDAFSLDFMSIPVFDASHPMVQSRLPALRAAMAGGSGVTTALGDHRNARHPLDKESMNSHIDAGGVPRYGEERVSALCPTCRHPVNEASLRIDTGLQDLILQYLKPPGATSAVR